MIKVQALFIGLAICFSTFTQDLNTIRESYLNATKNREFTEDFVRLLDSDQTQAVKLAYKATSRAMYADLVKGNLNKLKVFNEGRDLLERAVDMDNTNFEIRFLRFSIQTNIPLILGYNNISNDKSFMLNNLSMIDLIDYKPTRKTVYLLLLSSESLNEGEKNKVKRFLETKK